MRLDQRLRDSSDSFRSCSIIIIMNSKRCSNLKYKSRSFSSGSTHLFYLIEHTYVNACMQCMLHACNVCMCVCICVCVYISVIYIVSIYRHVCIYQLCSLILPSYMYVYINYEVSVYRHVYVYQCSI